MLNDKIIIVVAIVMSQFIKTCTHHWLVLNEYFESIYSKHYPKEIIHIVIWNYYQLFVIKIACGIQHNILRYDNKLYSWGQNYCGQLGNGATKKVKTPWPISLIKTNKLEIPNDGFLVKKISCDSDHSIVMTNSNNIYVWGSDEPGQLGIELDMNMNLPQRLPWTPDQSTIKKIICGYDRTMAVTNLGEVYVWGENYFGQLGPDRQEVIKTPSKIIFPNPEIKIKKVASGLKHTIALTISGEICAWGNNKRGQLGVKSEPAITSQPQFSLRRIRKIACGNYHSLALNDLGEVYAWGRNDYGQLGIGNFEDTHLPTKLDLCPVKKIICGVDYSMALTFSGELYAWGRNFYGQLGLGHHDNKNTPQKIQHCERPKSSIENSGLDSFINSSSWLVRYDPHYKEYICRSNMPPIRKIATGALHTIAIDIFNKIYSWGYNEHFQLGLGYREFASGAYTYAMNLPQWVKLFDEKIEK
jgi:alpha-tubulin suppressor-like RCC1 family protein